MAWMKARVPDEIRPPAQTDKLNQLTERIRGLRQQFEIVRNENAQHKHWKQTQYYFFCGKSIF